MREPAVNYTPFLAFALLMALPQTGQPSPEDAEGLRRQAAVLADKHRQDAIRINGLAGRIRTEQDARKLVDAVSQMFAKHVRWVPRDVRRRVIQAEYNAATDSTQLLTEERIAGVWNEYVREIGADEDARVTEKELHSLRDLKYATGKMMWSQGWNQTIWTVPNLYAVAPDGKLADGCRALEAIGLFYELDNHFSNVQTAKRLVREGVVASDQIQQAEERSHSLDRREVHAELRAGPAEENPVQLAERRYIAEHGVEAMHKLVFRLFDELLPDRAGQ